MSAEEIDHQIRALAKAMGPPSGAPVAVSFMQGVVASVETGSCTLYVQGSSEATPEWPYLLDAYVPTVMDVVWIIDGGPGSKFILGPTKRP